MHICIYLYIKYVVVHQPGVARCRGPRGTGPGRLHVGDLRCDALRGGGRRGAAGGDGDFASARCRGQAAALDVSGAEVGGGGSFCHLL